MLSAYLEVIRMRFLMMLAYRVNYYSGILIYALNIGSYYFVYKAIYGGQEMIGGLTLGQMTTYVAVSWMGRAFYFNNLDREIANEIRDGSVAIQFIRPYNYVFVKMMQGLGEGVFRLLLFTVPGMIFIWLLLPIEFPSDLSLWVIYFVMLFFSFLINTQLNIITGLFAFFLESNEGLMRMKRVAVDLFSGLIIPISFFPGWSESILKWMPFQAITYLPSAVFTGKITGSAVFQNLGIQVLWFVLLLIPMVVLWVKSKTRLFVQGVNTMTFYISLVAEYLKNYMKTRLTYRSDFWIDVISDLMFNGLNLFFILVVFLQTKSLGGWNQEQILFIYGYFMIPYGIFITFFNLWGFSERYIVKGEMDRILTRPAYNLWQLMLENLSPSSLFSALAGLIVMIYSWVKLEIPFHWHDPLVFILMVVGSILIYAGVYISLTALGFYSDAPTGILPLIWNIQNYGRYPATIYNKLLRSILTWILPFAFVGFYPAAYFIDPANWKWFALLTPVMGVVFCFIGITIWNIGVKRYRGAGS